MQKHGSDALGRRFVEPRSALPNGILTTREHTVDNHTEHPLVLRSLTLRGLGSYLHGARLDIRPFTILCGKNGSGKSTWFKILNLLSRSEQAGMLPFHFDLSDEDHYFHDHTNAFL